MVRKSLEQSLGAFARLLKENDDYLILTHKKPDGDTIGSAAALCVALGRIGKKAYLAGNSEVPQRLWSYMRPYIAPEDFVPENIITVDVPSYSQMDALTERFKSSLDFVIDHHHENTMEAAKGRLVETGAAATGEIIYYLAGALGVAPDRELAAPLYIALATDTGCFRYSNTSSETHRIAADCIDAGIDLEGINTEFFEKKRHARFEMEKLVYDGLRFYLSGKIASIYISREMRDKTGATEDDIDDFSSIPRQIEGVCAGISVYEQRDGSMKISLRTTREVDAAQICRRFGGGGHPRAAGCTLRTDYESAVKLLVDELSRSI